MAAAAQIRGELAKLEQANRLDADPDGHGARVGELLDQVFAEHGHEVYRDVWDELGLDELVVFWRWRLSQRGLCSGR